ncbi:MAG: SecD/SecF family protein translocase subunit, partial [Actinomycetota bacterium]|nr:SecD/SecF family protein translocase subunit [Actinomycetota bacterium]
TTTTAADDPTDEDDATTTTVAGEGDDTTSTTVAEVATSPSGCPVTPDFEAVAALSAQDELTPPEGDIATDPVLLAEYDDDGNDAVWYVLGCTELVGTAVADAQAALVGVSEWIVELEFEDGQDGIDGFNAIAARCFNAEPVCPAGALAIVLDGRVVSAPTINTPSFDEGVATITGGFTQSEAQDLATVLRFGALPVELEPQQTQEVSATIGQDALDAGLIAGAVGLALVALYIIAYYRLLGVVAMASLAISFGLLWTIIAYLGDEQGLALTLAGVTGIIVSIGVSVDSNIVYFEHLKEDIRSGRSVRSSADKAWGSAFSTIVKADLASLIGAGLLYWLTVGPVRGFAFYLGLATLLDLVASWFFLRPAVQLLARADRFQDNPKALGLPSVPEHLRIS